MIHLTIQQQRPLGYSELRALRNVEALDETVSAHWLAELNAPTKQLLHSISTLKPITGCKACAKNTRTLEAIYDYEKAFRCRNSVIDRIRTALAAQRQHATRYGTA